MLSTFQARDLPSLPPGPLLPQGVATYDEILTALNEVLRYCVASRSIPGYGSVGKEHFDQQTLEALTEML